MGNQGETKELPRGADARDFPRTSELEIYLENRFTARSRLGRNTKRDLSADIR